MTRCVGAFKRPCDNQTDAIMCADCYDLIDRVMNPPRRVPVRFSPRPKHGIAVRVQVKGNVA